MRYQQVDRTPAAFPGHNSSQNLHTIYRLPDVDMSQGHRPSLLRLWPQILAQGLLSGEFDRGVTALLEFPPPSLAVLA